MRKYPKGRSPQSVFFIMFVFSFWDCCAKIVKYIDVRKNSVAAIATV